MTKKLTKEEWNKEFNLELLNYDKKQHSILLDKQNDGFNIKLLTYSVILINHLHWEIRDEYLELIQNFVENQIDVSDFRTKFCKRYNVVEEVARILQSNRIFLSPNRNSADFGNLLLAIYDYCQIYSADPEPFRTEFEIGEFEFRSLVKKTYSKIQKLECFQGSSLNDLKVLQSTMIFLIGMTALVYWILS